MKIYVVRSGDGDDGNEFSNVRAFTSWGLAEQYIDKATTRFLEKEYIEELDLDSFKEDEG